MIKATLFDLGKVIVPFDLQRGYAALAPHCGYSVEEIPQRILSSDLVLRFEEGRISPEEFVREFGLLLQLNLTYAHFCKLWSSIFLPEPLIPEALLEGLRKQYRLILLSNTNAIHFEMIREMYPLLRHFDEYVLSYEVGAAKPAPRIYEEAIRRAGCSPGECFYTDDIPEFVVAAQEMGIDAVQFQSADQLQSDLRARGIRW